MSSSKRSPSPQPEPGPSSKRRKLGPGVTSQPSFADVLERLGHGQPNTESREESDSENSTNSWSRPPLAAILPKKDRIVFQQIDISVDKGSDCLLIFGVTEGGNSVLARVTDFHHYFYIPAPQGFTKDDVKPFRAALNSHLESEIVVQIDMSLKNSLMNYHGDVKVPFIKITLQDRHSLPKVKDEYFYSFCLFEQGLFKYRDLQLGSVTFESDISYVLRFMIDTKLVGMSWIEVPPGSYTRRIKKTSHCQLEFDMKWNAFISYVPEGVWSKLAPLRILSFDIECAGRVSTFPQAQVDPVIQIANMVTRNGEREPFIRNVFSFRTCDPIVGAQVLVYEKELDMLMAWHAFVKEVDPDLVIGYNISQFDLPYLLDRASALGGHQFPYLGRLKDVKAQVKDAHIFTRVKRLDLKETRVVGRLPIDMLRYIQNEYELPGYTLNSVCTRFLGEQKEEGVHWSIITKLWNETAKSRCQVAIYCLKDAYLPQLLMDNLMCLVKCTEMARVTGVPLNYLQYRGQSIQVLSLLYRKASSEKFVVPSGKYKPYGSTADIGPLKGYDEVPINLAKSPDPRIMVLHNLCYTTLLERNTVTRLGLVKDVDYVVTPNKNYFVTAAKRKGLIPIIIEELLLALKHVESGLEKEKDQIKRAVLDGRRLALEKIAKSVHGFTHATTGNLPCPQLSWSVIAFDRQLKDKAHEDTEKPDDAL